VPTTIFRALLQKSIKQGRSWHWVSAALSGGVSLAALTHDYRSFGLVAHGARKCKLRLSGMHFLCLPHSLILSCRRLISGYANEGILANSLLLEL
jgi:hypothetical protein